MPHSAYAKIMPQSFVRRPPTAAVATACSARVGGVRVWYRRDNTSLSSQTHGSRFHRLVVFVVYVGSSRPDGSSCPSSVLHAVYSLSFRSGVGGGGCSGYGVTRRCTYTERSETSFFLSLSFSVGLRVVTSARYNDNYIINNYRHIIRFEYVIHPDELQAS